MPASIQRGELCKSCSTSTLIPCKGEREDHIQIMHFPNSNEYVISAWAFTFFQTLIRRNNKWRTNTTAASQQKVLRSVENVWGSHKGYATRFSDHKVKPSLIKNAHNHTHGQTCTCTLTPDKESSVKIESNANNAAMEDLTLPWSWPTLLLKHHWLTETQCHDLRGKHTKHQMNDISWDGTFKKQKKKKKKLDP